MSLMVIADLSKSFYADSTMEAKYDAQTQTLYLRVSQAEEIAEFFGTLQKSQ